MIEFRPAHGVVLEKLATSVREREDVMATKIAGIGPSPRLLFLCFLPLAVLIIGLAADQYVRQRAALLNDLAGKANEQHGFISASLEGAGPQLARLRLSMGLDLFKPEIGIAAILDTHNNVVSINGEMRNEDRVRLKEHMADVGLSGVALNDTPGLNFERQDDFRVLTRRFGISGYKFVYLVPNEELRLFLLPRFAPFLFILAGLVATVFGIFYFLHRTYIVPSLRLARYISDHASGSQAIPPALPSIWRKQFSVVSNAFASSRRYQAQLEESEARFLAATASLRDGFAIIGPDGKLAFFNEALTWHLSEEQREKMFVGRDVREFVDSIWAGSNGVDIERQLDNGRWVAGRQSVMPDGGRVILLRDVTERKEAQEALSVSEARMSAFLNYAPVAMLAKDLDGYFTMVNPEALKRLKKTTDEVIGKKTADLLPPDEAEAMDRSIAQVLATGKMQLEEQHHPSLDPFLYSLFIRFPLRAHTGEITGAGVFVVDQTREKLAELELDQQRGALHQSEKLAALGSLLAGVAHELNNPLSIVVGYAGMLNEMATDEATKRRTRELHSAAERCGRIVKTFLSMARSKPIEKRSVDMDTVIDDVLELAAYGLRSNGVTVVRKRADKLPSTLADPDQMHQVFMNIVLNAQQAMMDIDGARTLDVESRFDGEELAIDISDTGRGIPEEIKHRIYEPFFTTKPQGVGTGIGLSVCIRIVQAHGGTIFLDNADTGGAICRIRLPVTAATLGPDAGLEEASFRLSGKLLVVDDEPAIGRYVSEYLTAEGVEVTAVASGRKAQTLLRNGTPFDAVLTDLRMPDVSGDKLIAFIAAKRPDLSGRVVIMTGDALGPEINTTSSDVPVIVKPLELSALRSALRPMLDRNERNAAADEGVAEDQREKA
jgi:PAS domain S-box-containing protein